MDLDKKNVCQSAAQYDSTPCMDVVQSLRKLLDVSGVLNQRIDQFYRYFLISWSNVSFCFTTGVSWISVETQSKVKT